MTKSPSGSPSSSTRKACETSLFVSVISTPGLAAAAGFIGTVADGLRASASMAYETAWAIVVGFLLSGLVQVFVSKEAMQRRLGDHGPAAVVRAAGYGVASSSCSYAAAALSRSLVRKGADFVVALVFMVASTNLVLELGLVLVVLMGWQFMAGEFVGGVIMIGLLATVGGAALASARPSTTGASHSRTESGEEADGGLRQRLEDAAALALGELVMLRRELVLGYLLAGFLAVVVPVSAWSEIFLRGNGGLTTLENALVAPLIAAASCVCSIGNVPLAAALWHRGISFGGVMSFLFGDLVALPLLLVYRRMYGWHTAVRLALVLYVVMVAAGLATGMIFTSAGLVPAGRGGAVSGRHVSFGATGVADLAALVLLAGVFVLARRARARPAPRFATDPVCRMRVERASAPASLEHEGVVVFFCSERCRDRFSLDSSDPTGLPTGASETDPVCGMSVSVASPARSYAGRTYRFCGTRCAEAFEDDPGRYARTISA